MSKAGVQFSQTWNTFHRVPWGISACKTHSGKASTLGTVTPTLPLGGLGVLTCRVPGKLAVSERLFLPYIRKWKQGNDSWKLELKWVEEIVEGSLGHYIQQPLLRSNDMDSRTRSTISSLWSARCYFTFLRNDVKMKSDNLCVLFLAPSCVMNYLKT